MKFLKFHPGYAHYIRTCLLEGDEKDLPDEVLAMMADGRPREVAEKIFAEKGHPGHFGASLERRNGKVNPDNVYIRVRINTD